MTLPHHFPSLIEGPAQVVLIVGAGLSAPNLETVKELTPKLNELALALGIPLKPNFYELAEDVLNKIVAGGKKTEPESRLWLAEQLGLLDDRRYFGDIGLPLSGNTPRHRVIARFAVEDRLQAVVSLNWDAMLEAALDSVGLVDGGGPPRPWKITAYARVIEDAHMPCLAKANVLPVIKPHGCVRDLKEARRIFQATGSLSPITFKLTKSELSSLSAGQTRVDKKVEICISECPMIVFGWKATEDYLRSTIITAVEKVKPSWADSFTLVNRSWYPKPVGKETYHEDIAKAYGKTEAECFVAVGKNGEPSVDQLLLWLQARHALTKMVAVVSGRQRVFLQKLLGGIDSPDCCNPLFGWADRWLPAWVRLCWRTGVMQGNDPSTGQKVEPWAIPVMPRDVHVPLGTMNGERLELQAAAKLLITLGDDLKRFKFDMFPGGLWDEKEQFLYIPLPSWGEVEKHSDLAALKPQVEAMRKWGYVRKICLIEIGRASCRERV